MNPIIDEKVGISLICGMTWGILKKTPIPASKSSAPQTSCRWILVLSLSVFKPDNSPIVGLRNSCQRNIGMLEYWNTGFANSIYSLNDVNNALSN